MQCDTGEYKINKKINEGLQKCNRKNTMLIKKNIVSDQKEEESLKHVLFL